jgi:sarcosine oxidase subunit alpha
MDGNEIAGRVTSIARRSTLGRPLGLAFVRPDLARPGGRVTIRADQGREVVAEVAALPFYDPQNKRQE